MPDYNPFRLFIPLSSACQLLRHIIIAAAAAHMSNVLDPPSNIVPSHVPGTRQHTSEASRRALEDALGAKQQALQLLRLEIQNGSPVVSDTLLIAVQFFIAVELIESGKHGWKAHLEGTGRILGQLPPIDGDYKVLRDFIISDCYICYIFAATFTKELIRSSSYSHTVQSSSIIRYAAHNSYICCPAEILQILLAAAQLSNEEADDDASKNRVIEQGMKLMTDAMSFDLHAWASDIETIPKGRQVTELESRTHAGLAHQSACCLYILYAVPSIRDLLPPDIEETLERDLTSHLLAISDEDPNFKTAFWPTFVAGAQARDSDRRAWIMARMQRQAVLYPWGFVYTAIDTLRFIWDQKSDGGSKRNWLQILQDPDVNFLLI
ncbi:hypothetical protein FDECE_10934 [Fusarium decemcellulare]|nr:hypothetical protein FDECE_10934 [Fusarium decemcellulare]